MDKDGGCEWAEIGSKDGVDGEVKFNIGMAEDVEMRDEMAAWLCSRSKSYLQPTLELRQVHFVIMNRILIVYPTRKNHTLGMSYGNCSLSKSAC